MASWFYREDGRKVGPVSEAELTELVSSGRIASGASVQAEGEEGWSRLDERLYRRVGGPPPHAADLAPPANSGWTDTAPHPWRRHFGRMVDYAITGTGLLFLLLIVGFGLFPGPTDALAELLDGRAGAFFSAFLIFLVAIPANALLIGLTGGSVGKWIFGVKVVRPDGGAIGVPAAFRRELNVWLRGMGLGLPLVPLFTLIGSYQGLMARRRTPWDDPSERIVVHRPPSLPWTIVMILAVVALFAERFVIALLSQ